MARTLENIVDFMRYIVRKQRGVFLTTDEATLNLDTGQLDAMEEWFKLYGINQEVHDAIRPFMITNQSFTSDSTGYVSFLPNYIHLVGQPYTISGGTINRVVFVNEDELPFALISQLRPVTNTYPIAVDTSTGFLIYPKETQEGFYHYLRRPSTPVYAYLLNDREILYDAANSVNLEWEEPYINHIIAKALKYVGVNMGETDVYQFAEQYNQETK